MQAKRRHIAKTLTWRIIASLTTFLLALFFFREAPDANAKAANVAIIEGVLKMIIYYYHERIWFGINFRFRSAVRHLIKAVTWRLIASITTFAVAFIVFQDDPKVAEKSYEHCCY